MAEKKSNKNSGKTSSQNLIKKATKKKGKKSLRNTIISTILAIILLIIGYFAYNNYYQPDDNDNDNETYGIPDGVAEFHYIDVGQGDSTLIMVGGKNVLIDTGDRDAQTKLDTYLKEHNVSEIEYFIITHFDSDHFGNATYILNNYTVKNVVIPVQVKSTKMYTTFISTLETKTDINVIKANDIVGTSITVGDLEMNILAPLNEYSDSNNNSICLLARFGKNKFLFTGDAEEKALDDIDEKYASKDLNCDVFQAGHHGSRNANTEALMNKATPSIIVISCGKDNSYGHPHSEAMAIFQATGATIYRTDENGSIVLETDGENITKK
jgi:competence protein ComEC